LALGECGYDDAGVDTMNIILVDKDGKLTYFEVSPELSTWQDIAMSKYVPDQYGDTYSDDAVEPIVIELDHVNKVAKLQGEDFSGTR